MANTTLPRIVDDSGRRTDPLLRLQDTDLIRNLRPRSGNNHERARDSARHAHGMVGIGHGMLAELPPSTPATARERRAAPRPHLGHGHETAAPVDSSYRTSFQVDQPLFATADPTVVDRAAFHSFSDPRTLQPSPVKDILEVIGTWPAHTVYVGSGMAEPPKLLMAPDNRRLLDVPSSAEVILLLSYVQSADVACGLIKRFKALLSLPPVIVILLRPAQAAFDPRLVRRATDMLLNLSADNVLVQPRDKLDLPEMLHAALSMVHAHWDVEKNFFDQIDDRANTLFFENVDAMIQGFPKLNASIPEKLPSRASLGGVGKHDFIQKVGEGKFGIVYKTSGNPENVDSRLPASSLNPEAVKVISKRSIRTPKHANQVLKECRLIQKVKHPSIVEFRGLIHARLNLYLFMEFVGSTDLSGVIRGGNQGRLESELVLELFLQISDAVSFCHHHAVAHRDIKSENIVVTEENVPKLVDFGLAVHLSSPPQLLEDKCGTIPFAPPEVYRGLPFEATAMDVWSLGIMTLEMRCGNNSVCHMLGCGEKTEPNEHLAGIVEHFFNHPDWPSFVKRSFPGVGMAEELMAVLRGCLVIAPENRWSAAAVWQHIANSPSSDRITGRMSLESADRSAAFSGVQIPEDEVLRGCLELDTEFAAEDPQWDGIQFNNMARQTLNGPDSNAPRTGKMRMLKMPRRPRG